MTDTLVTDRALGLALSPEEMLKDYRLAYQSRQASYIGRREVMGGKAKFGIFGDGKELPQVAMAHAFRPGDWRSGYYRDQTLAFATGMCTIQEFFAQLYAHADVQADPATAGRAMNAHFATRSIDPAGKLGRPDPAGQLRRRSLARLRHRCRARSGWLMPPSSTASWTS